MNGWIICYRKIDKESLPSTIRINRDNVISISLYSECLEIEFVNGKCKQLFFTDWDIKL